MLTLASDADAQSIISNRQLREAFLTRQMQCYFERKFPHVDAAEVGVRVEETLKFLNIATFCHGSIPVTQELDDIWHYWILETREYARLCDSLHGRRFIHHCSNTYSTCADDGLGEAPVTQLEDDVAILATYVRNYGPFQADRIKYWLLPRHLVHDCGWSVDQLNTWLTSARSS